MRSPKQQYARELSRMSREDRIFSKALRGFKHTGVHSIADAVAAAYLRVHYHRKAASKS
jgi:hypothetical protein